MRYHVTQLTPEAAMKHERFVHGIADKPEVGIGWVPYTHRVTQAAVSQWATVGEDEFNRRRLQAGLSVPEWGPWSDGVRSAWMVSHD